MLLTITSTHPPATDLGYLLHKRPDRFQTFELSFGKAHVFYPEASEERCTAVLLLDLDPVRLVRGRGGAGIEQYVNDRPYVASSFLSVAIARVFGTALGGRSKSRPGLAASPLPLEAQIPVLPSRGGEPVIRRLFEPLGYEVETQDYLLDERFPEWGRSRYFRVRLCGTVRLKELLSHLYVLVPVLDDEKHYWVDEDEIAKLLRHGSEWLPSHPERELIVRRYLVHQRSLAEEALGRIADETVEETQEEHDLEEAEVEERISLNEHRIGSVMAALRASKATRVLDLGCGEGQLLRRLLDDIAFTEIVGMDVSKRALDRAALRLHLDRLPEKQRNRISLIQGSLMYRDQRLKGYGAAAAVEVIEHLDPPRLAAFERAIFEYARPGTVVVTTPNVEYNIRWEALPGGKFRHKDHRFEWTRAELADWVQGVAERFGYTVRWVGIGPDDPEVGPPTQMAVFDRD